MEHSWYQCFVRTTKATAVNIELNTYDRILVAFSGGKDSLACVLHLLDLGVAREKIELHHHDVDGGARAFMDWTVTPAYCRAVAAALGIRIFFSYKVGGFEREMLRENARTAPMRWQSEDGTWIEMGGTRGNETTRRKFPQVSADLSVRWCSAYLKIDVMSAMIRNEDRFLTGKTLVITGERAQESAARARYSAFEPDRTDNRDGVRVSRHVDRWRPVLQWSEAEVWAIIQKHGVVPHPAYQLGWGRLSCMTCIFGSPNQWATIRAIFPERFAAVLARETEFGVTIKRGATIAQLADRGTPYAAALSNPDLVRLANAEEWTGPILTDNWQLPAGAFGENAGPT
jgi:3'-phosphoadenosine 5'-phosphosulfate sulfotransferase (PAPS reductase)/FAD synthetase